MSNLKNLTIPDPCPHLADFRSLHGPQPFRALQDCLRAKPMGRASIRREPSEVPRCGACVSSGAAAARPRLYACVSCAAVHCHAPSSPRSHAAAHAESMPPGHEIAVDVDRAELFCCRCRDQVYDRDFDAAVVSAAVGTLIPSPPLLPPHPENLRKRRRIDYQPWTPDPTERILIGQNSSLLLPGMDATEDRGVNAGSHLGSGSDFPWGLRGLNNLGNTCFMSSVLQALLHTPPLRNYFLSDKHNRYLCQSKNNGIAVDGKGGDNARKNGVKGGGNGNESVKSLCLACDLDAIFSAVFSGERSPFSPARFLYSSWWQHAANLATYEQQDAHEFFISILDGIHEKVKDSRKAHSQASGDCCIAHRVFSGILRSDVMCTACGFTSTTYDPFVDISLDLEPHILTKKKTSSLPTKSHHSCNGETEASRPTKTLESSSTLTGCLDRFTRPERLGPDQKFFCQHCQVKQESLKQMSIRKLPLVSCFHIKRFEHSPYKNMSKKIDRYLQFPFSLDMAPYLSSSILRGRFGNRIFAFDEGEEVEEERDGLASHLEDSSSEFELFAVITHTGKLNAGHYVTYLRLSNQWYKCDDAWITQVNESIVRAAQGYMMFYVQKMLYYRASSERPEK